MDSPSLDPSVRRKTGSTQRAPRRVVRANWLPTEPMRSCDKKGVEVAWGAGGVRRGWGEARLARAAWAGWWVGSNAWCVRCAVLRVYTHEGRGAPRGRVRVRDRDRSRGRGEAHREALGVHELLVLVGAEGSEDVGDARREQSPHREVCHRGRVRVGAGHRVRVRAVRQGVGQGGLRAVVLGRVAGLMGGEASGPTQGSGNGPREATSHAVPCGPMR